MNRSSKIVPLILLVPMFVAAAAWVIYHETRIPQNEKEALNRMIELQQEGRYEKFEIGGSYEILGDLSEKDKCRLYEKAHRLLVQQLRLIKGDSYTAYGHTTPLDPVRGEVNKHLDAVNEKLSKVGCHAHSVQ